jgi:hypothetical protein
MHYYLPTKSIATMHISNPDVDVKNGFYSYSGKKMGESE